MNKSQKQFLSTIIFCVGLFLNNSNAQDLIQIEIKPNYKVYSVCEYYSFIILEESDSSILFLWWDKDAKTPLFLTESVENERNEITVSNERPFRVHVPYNKKGMHHAIPQLGKLICDNKEYLFVKYQTTANTK